MTTSGPLGPRGRRLAGYDQLSYTDKQKVDELQARIDVLVSTSGHVQNPAIQAQMSQDIKALEAEQTVLLEKIQTVSTSALPTSPKQLKQQASRLRNSFKTAKLPGQVVSILKRLSQIAHRLSGDDQENVNKIICKTLHDYSKTLPVDKETQSLFRQAMRDCLLPEGARDRSSGGASPIIALFESILAAPERDKMLVLDCVLDVSEANEEFNLLAINRILAEIGTSKLDKARITVLSNSLKSHLMALPSAAIGEWHSNIKRVCHNKPGFELLLSELAALVPMHAFTTQRNMPITAIDEFLREGLGMSMRLDRPPRAITHFIDEHTEALCHRYLADLMPAEPMSSHPEYSQLNAVFGEPLTSIYLHTQSLDAVPVDSVRVLESLMAAKMEAHANTLRANARAVLPRLHVGEEHTLAGQLWLALAQGLEPMHNEPHQKPWEVVATPAQPLSLTQLTQRALTLAHLDQAIDDYSTYQASLPQLTTQVDAILRDEFGLGISLEGREIMGLFLDQYEANMAAAVAAGQPLFSAAAPTHVPFDMNRLVGRPVSEQEHVLVTLQLVSEIMHQVHADGGIFPEGLPSLTQERIADVRAAKSAQVAELNRTWARLGQHSAEVQAAAMVDQATDRQDIVEAVTQVLQIKSADEKAVAIMGLMHQFSSHEDVFVLFGLLGPALRELPQDYFMMCITQFLSQCENAEELLAVAQVAFSSRTEILNEEHVRLLVEQVIRTNRELASEPASMEQLVATMTGCGYSAIVQALQGFSAEWGKLQRNVDEVLFEDTPVSFVTNTGFARLFRNMLKRFVAIVRGLFPLTQGGATIAERLKASMQAHAGDVLDLCYQLVRPKIGDMTKAQFEASFDAIVADSIPTTRLSAVLKEELASAEVQSNPVLRGLYERVRELEGQGVKAQDIADTVLVLLEQAIYNTTTREGLRILLEHIPRLEYALQTVGGSVKLQGSRTQEVLERVNTLLRQLDRRGPDGVVEWFKLMLLASSSVGYKQRVGGIARAVLQGHPEQLAQVNEIIG